MSEWFERWFGEDYLKLYPHRDDEDAGRAVTLIASRIPLAGRRVLDLACGPGRHAVHLEAAGATVVGIDLSRALLDRARTGQPSFTRVIRGDMRALPFLPASFDDVVNLFTSFGYFETDEEHAAVLTRVGELLRSGGSFVIDYLNAEHVRANLVPSEDKDVAGQRVEISREIISDGRFVRKTMHVPRDAATFVERVRLFSPDDLGRMMRAAGLDVEACLGDYDGREWSSTSPRTILFARKP